MRKDEILTKEDLQVNSKVLRKEWRKDMEENNIVLVKMMGPNMRQIVKEAVHEEFNGALFQINPAGKLSKPR